MPVPTTDEEALERLAQAYYYNPALPYDPNVAESHVRPEQTHANMTDVLQYVFDRDVAQLTAGGAALKNIDGGVDVLAPSGATTSGLQNFDGVTGAVDLKVLVPDKGVYLMKTGAWTRLSGYTTYQTLQNGLLTSVRLGTTHAGKVLMQNAVLASLSTPQDWREMFSVSAAAPSNRTKKKKYTLPASGLGPFTLSFLPIGAVVTGVQYLNFIDGETLVETDDYEFDPDTRELAFTASLGATYEPQEGEKIVVEYLVAAPANVFQLSAGTIATSISDPENPHIEVPAGSGTIRIPGVYVP